MTNNDAQSKTELVQPSGDKRLVDSWHKNARAWTVAVREDQIESRKLVTNKAIIEAVMSRRPRHVLDIGCGEGWLAHRLAGQGLQVIGTDVVPELIERAAAVESTSRFEVMSYEEIVQGKISETFDVVVCNFALLGSESVDTLFTVIPKLLNSRGAFIVQISHPTVACGELPYVDGWRPGSWAGFSSEFTDPVPWYFRTIETWVRLFTSNKLKIVEMREPLHPKTEKAASVIFIGERSS